VPSNQDSLPPEYLAEAKFYRVKGRRYPRLLGQYIKTTFTKKGKVLCIGPASGFVLQGFTDEGWEGKGIDPYPQLAKCAQDEMNLEVATGQLAVPDLKVKEEEEYDLVCMIHTIAQWTDLQATFQTAASLTRSNGLWLIEINNRDSWTARLFGKRWRGYNQADVCHWFSDKDLQRLAAQYGFREVAKGKPSLWVNASHAKARLRRQLQGNPFKGLIMAVLGLVPDNLPLWMPAEDTLWLLYRKLW
jgi:hypothetical protein